jgi:phosphoenolpyruvate carboxykinase (GTP)
MANNPVLDSKADDPAGVPVSALVFGGRRSTAVPLIYQAFDWMHGVYLGAMLGSETTAAAAGKVGVVRRDPMAMIPFCGYNMGWYFGHWLRMRKRMKECPRLFHVNWFRKDNQGKFIWPGYGENMRVLEWIVGRSLGHARASETVLGWMPPTSEVNLQGMDPAKFEAAQAVDTATLKQEIISQEELFMKLAGDMPKELIFQRELLVSRL